MTLANDPDLIFKKIAGILSKLNLAHQAEINL